MPESSSTKPSVRSTQLRPQAPGSPLQAVPRYRDLLQIKELFRTAKSLMDTRPIYHSSDAAIRGRVFQAAGVALPDGPARPKAC